MFLDGGPRSILQVERSKCQDQGSKNTEIACGRNSSTSCSMFDFGVINIMDDD